jgi:Flp pilus assembly protein TadD
MQPGSATAHNNLGNMYGASGRYEDAIGELRRSLQIDPGDWIVHFWLGCLYLQQNSATDAVRAFHQSLRLRGESALIRYNLALCYEAIDERELARNYIDRAIELNPELGTDMI